MTTDAGNTPVKRTLDDIAALMAENTMKMRGTVPNEGSDDDKEAQAAVQDEVSTGRGTDERADTNADGTDDNEPTLDAADADGEEADAGADDTLAEDSGDAEGEFEVDDDTLFALDDDTEVSFKDLRERYKANEEAARLTEEQRTVVQEAIVERQKALEQSEQAKQAASAVFEHFEKLVSTPLVSKPDEALKASDPARYIEHLDYYTQDQQRIAQQKADLHQAFDQHLQKEAELKDGLRQQMLVKLTEAIPALKSSDPEIKKRASTDILDAATHYGFSKEEVNGALDYRLYQMAHDAQQYRKLMAGKDPKAAAETPEEKQTKVRNQTRTLRPRGTSAKNRLTVKAKLVKAAKSKAATTGKVDDVADFLTASKTR